MHSQDRYQTPDIRSDRRLEALVKKQTTEHEHLIENHNKEMQSIREEMRLVLQKCNALSEKNYKETSELKDTTETHISNLKNNASNQSSIITDQKRAIDSFNDKINFFHENYITKSDIEKLKKEMESKISSSIMDNIIFFQNWQMEIKALCLSIKEDSMKIFEDLKQNISDNASSNNENFFQGKLDKEGIHKELAKHKDAIFYIEKKIENIYTLIERIKKGN